MGGKGGDDDQKTRYFETLRGKSRKKICRKPGNIPPRYWCRGRSKDLVNRCETLSPAAGQPTRDMRGLRARESGVFVRQNMSYSFMIL